MSVVDKLKSTEAVIAAAAAAVAAAAKYAAVSGLLNLPEGVAGLAPHLSTLAAIVFTLVAIFLADAIMKLSRLVIGLVIVAMLTAGIVLSVRFAENLREQTVQVECVGYPSAYVLEPNSPSPRLASLIDDGGGLENAWCEEDRTTVRRLVSRENAGQVTSLTLLLIAAQTLLMLALTLAGWLVASKPSPPPGPTPTPAPPPTGPAETD